MQDAGTLISTDIILQIVLSLGIILIAAKYLGVLCKKIGNILKQYIKMKCKESRL